MLLSAIPRRLSFLSPDCSLDFFHVSFPRLGLLTTAACVPASPYGLGCHLARIVHAILIFSALLALALSAPVMGSPLPASNDDGGAKVCVSGFSLPWY